MASGTGSITDKGSDKGAKLDKPMPNGQTRMSPQSPTPPAQPVKH